MGKLKHREVCRDQAGAMKLRVKLSLTSGEFGSGARVQLTVNFGSGLRVFRPRFRLLV